MNREVAKVLAIFFSVFALVVIGMNALINVSCHARWKNSGFPIHYSFMEGCQISVNGKTFIPEENYREVP